MNKSILLFFFCTVMISHSYSQGTNFLNTIAFKGGGTSDGVRVTNANIGNPAGSFTLETWVKMNVLTDGVKIISKHSTGNKGYTFEYSGGAVKAVLGTALPSWVSLSGGALEANEWYHLAMTYNATTKVFTFYVNGVQKATQTLTAAAAFSTYDLMLGTSAAYGAAFNGELDEVRIWDDCLTQAALQGQMYSTLTGTEPNLKAYFKLDAVTGTVVENNASVATYEAAISGNVTAANVCVPFFRNALKLGGVSASRVTIPHANISNPISSFSAQIWLKGSFTGTVVSKHGLVNGITAGYYIESLTAGKINVGLGSSDNKWNSLTTTMSDAYLWNNVTIVYDAITKYFKLYVNGDAVDSVIVVKPNFTTTDLCVGASQYYQTGASGAIDEFRYWNKALTQNEVRSNIFTKLVGNEASLSAYLPLDTITNGTTVENKVAGFNAIANNLVATNIVRSTLADNAVTNMNRTILYFTNAPVLQNLTDTSVDIVWQVNKMSVPYVRFGNTTTLNNVMYSSQDGQIDANINIQKIHLDHLIPGTTYYYKAVSKEIASYASYSVVYRDVLSADLQSFTTPASTEDTFTFLAFSDAHEDHAYIKTVCENNPEAKFVCFAGDMLNSITSEAQIQNGLINPVGKYFAGIKPLVFARGTTELRGSFARNLINYLVTPNGKYYYTVKYGNTLIVVLDMGEDKVDNDAAYAGLSVFDAYRTEQIDWLTTVMTSADWAATTHHVILSHFPLTLNTSDPATNQAHGVVDACQKFIPLLNGKVDLVISGQTHLPELLRPDAEHAYTQAICGGPQTTTNGASYAKISVIGNSLKVDLFTKTGVLIDTYKCK